MSVKPIPCTPNVLVMGFLFTFILFYMPTKAEVQTKVNDDIAEYSGISLDRIQPELVLAKSPISLADPSWDSLTLSLRDFIKSHKPENTIKASELKKKDLTVQGLLDLVYSRV